MGSRFLKPVILALVLAAAVETCLGASASLSTRTEASSNSPTGFARASTDIRVTRGFGSAVGIASSEAVETSKSEILEIVKKIIDILPAIPDPFVKKDYCIVAGEAIEIDAKAVGQAAAQVTVTALSEVVIDGEGSGCASTEASGEAFAVSFAEIFVDALVNSGIKDFNPAKAKAVVGAQTNAFAAAFAEATASACLEGEGFALAEQEVFAEAIAHPVATVVMFLETLVDCTGLAEAFVEASAGVSLEEVVSNVEATATTEIEGQGDVDATASAFAVTGRLCTKEYKRCCRLRRGMQLKQGEICYCNGLNRLRGKKCVAEKNILKGGDVFFKDVENEDSDFSCACNKAEGV